MGLNHFRSNHFAADHFDVFANDAASSQQIITRLGFGGFGVRRVDSFAGKVVSHRITRLGFGGFGVQRIESFAGKTESPIDSAGGEWLVRARRRGRR